MKHPGKRHLAVVEKQDLRLQDSSPDLAAALERAAAQYGGEMERFKYTNCKCGLLVRLGLLPDSREFREHKITAWAGVCPDCKRQLQVTIIPPATAVKLAAPGDVPAPPAAGGA